MGINKIYYGINGETAKVNKLYVPSPDGKSVLAWEEEKIIDVLKTTPVKTIDYGIRSDNLNFEYHEGTWTSVWIMSKGPIFGPFTLDDYNTLQMEYYDVSNSTSWHFMLSRNSDLTTGLRMYLAENTQSNPFYELDISNLTGDYYILPVFTSIGSQNFSQSMAVYNSDYISFTDITGNFYNASCKIKNIKFI